MAELRDTGMSPLPTQTFDRATDKWGQRQRWTRLEVDQHRELEAAFRTWAGEHGLIWFDNDSALAKAIAGVLGIDLNWGDDDD